MREFLHVRDMAEACVFLMNLSGDIYKRSVEDMVSHINVGSGVDCTISELAKTISSVVGYSGDIIFDDSKPDGTPRKLMDVNRLTELGWSCKISLEDGISDTYNWFVKNESTVRF